MRLTRTAIGIMDVLQQHGMMSEADVVARLGVHGHTVQAHARVLTARGLVTRRRWPMPWLSRWEMEQLTPAQRDVAVLLGAGLTHEQVRLCMGYEADCSVSGRLGEIVDALDLQRWHRRRSERLLELTLAGGAVMAAGIVEPLDADTRGVLPRARWAP